MNTIQVFSTPLPAHPGPTFLPAQHALVQHSIDSP